MARKIDFSKPLSADELAYVNDRPWLKADAVLSGFTITSEDDDFVVEDPATDPNLAIVNEYSTPEGGNAAEDEEDDDAPYEEWTVDQLKEELKARELAVSGSKEQLVGRLEEHDAENADDSEDES